MLRLSYVDRTARERATSSTESKEISVSYRRKTLGIVLPAVGVLVLGGTLPGWAGAAEGAKHCNVDVRTNEQHCFATLDQAVADARGGSMTRANSVVVGTLFDNRDFGGESFTVYGAAPCEKDGEMEYQITLPDNWKDRVSSAQPWANCWLWLYPEPDLGGERDGPFKENTQFVGDLMDDRAKSVGFS
jgi:hypothetical protein